jgi:calcineurin-like phosphoesterase
LDDRAILARMRPRPHAAVVDFHAEASEEKEALAFHLDGKVSAVVGTHTHVQTADERVLPGGTGYLTDAGMCGSSSGVIGMRADVSLRRFVTQMPLKMEVDDGPPVLHGVLLDIDSATGGCRGISRVQA